jgi:penicillin-binding protein 1B
LRSQLALDPSGVFLVNRALQEVVRSGTARALAQEFPKSLALAGKTGTTDGYRDSWFVGYAGNILAVVWLGLDNNGPTGLTGASGALKVWARLMRQLPLRPVQLYQPKNIIWARTERSLTEAPCTMGNAMPFVMGTQPAGTQSCSPAQASAKEQPRSSRWWQGVPALLSDLDSRP